MRYKTLKQFWGRLVKKESLTSKPSEAKGRLVTIRPITMGLRLGVKSPAGGRGETSVSKVIWVSAAGSHRPAKNLTVLLSPN